MCLLRTRSHLTIVSIAILLSSSFGSPSVAIDYSWDRGAGTNSVFNTSNFNPDGIPMSDDNIILIHSLASAQIIDLDVTHLAMVMSIELNRQLPRTISQ
jgi:hypothetical protein